MTFITPNKFTPNLGHVAKSHAARAAGIAIEAGAGYLFEKGSKAAMHEINNIHKKLRESIKDIKVGPTCTIGSISNGLRPIINNSAEEIVFKHMSSFEKLGLSEASSTIYKTVFHTGQPSTKSLYDSAKDNIIDLKTLIDTERDYISSEKRRALTSVFGFNQRSFDLLLDDTFTKVQDLNFLYRNERNNFKTDLANVSYYGNIFWEHTNIRIKSETDYYSIRLKIHLVKLLNVEKDVEQLVTSTFNMDLNTEEEGKLPLGRQLSVPVNYGKFRCNVLTDLKCTLNLSDSFKNNARIVKTFHRTLGPSDIWNFDFYLHYGPGILLNRIHEEMLNKETNKHPASYFFVIQAEGDPRASLTRTLDGENFNGTGPGRFNYSLQRRLKFVKKPSQKTTVLTTRQFVRNDEDFEDVFFQDYFTPDREKKINVPINEINVNRLEDPKYGYQVRYGEGRLSLYIEPYLKQFAKINSETSPLNATNATLVEDVGDDRTDPDERNETEKDPTRGTSLRRAT